MAQGEVAIATFNTETEAMMAAELLQNEGIPTVLVPLGPGAGGFGQTVWRPFQLRVWAADADRARQILAEVAEEPPPEEESDEEDE